MYKGENYHPLFPTKRTFLGFIDRGLSVIAMRKPCSMDTKNGSAILKAILVKIDQRRPINADPRIRLCRSNTRTVVLAGQVSYSLEQL